MERKRTMLIDDWTTQHSTGEFGEGLESIKQESDEQNTTTGESTSGGFRNVEPDGTNDDSDDDRREPRDDEGELILPFEQKLTFSQSPDLEMERNRVDRFLRGVTFAFFDGDLEIVIDVLFLFHCSMVLGHLSRQASGSLGLVEGFSELLWSGRSVGLISSCLVLSFVLLY